MRRTGTLILHVNIRGVRTGGDEEVGLHASVGDRIDEIDTGEDAAIGDAAVCGQVDPPLGGSAEHEVDAGRQFVDSLDDGGGICAVEAHAEGALAHGEHGAIRAEIAGERGAFYDVADAGLFRAELSSVLDEEERHLAVCGLRRLHKPSRQDAPGRGRPEAGAV